MTEKDVDWLFPDAEKNKALQEEKGLVWAQKYLVFEQDPRARDLLAHWLVTVRRQTISPAASVQEYAYWNARRELFEHIQAQIEFAKNGLNQPKPRTTT